LLEALRNKGGSHESRKIIARTRGNNHGPITRIVSPPSRIAELIKPFVFLDHFKHDGSFDGFGLHPHSGIATLTVMNEGTVNYIDTAGKTGTVPTGGLEWMKAGGGAWHGGKGGSKGPKNGFQLWISLPPEVEDSGSESIYASPDQVKSQGNTRVLLGVYGEAKSPFVTPAPMNYFQVVLKEGEHWHYEPPKGHTVGWAYPYKGSLRAGESIPNGELAVFEASESAIDLEAVGETAFLFGSAVPHGYPLVLGRYSVHTNAQSLEDSEERICKVERRLVEEGKLSFG
jgi:redox-sensitive bicupin YhaK (pirin superfamily)